VPNPQDSVTLPVVLSKDSVLTAPQQGEEPLHSANGGISSPHSMVISVSSEEDGKHNS
jgi:hypothetical protein